MKEKILALLTAKFAGVRKDGLARLAQALSLQAENETQAGEIVEKLTPEKVNEFVTDYRKDVDKEVSDANKTFESTLKKKFEFVEKKDAEPGKDPKPSTDPNDIATLVANAVSKAVEPLQQKLSAFETGKTTETRLQQIEAKFQDVPESYKQQRLNDAKLLIGSMDETAFAEYSTRLEGDIAGFKQELADKGLSGSRPLMGGQNKDGVSSAVSQFIESKTKPDAALTGKEI